KESLPETWLGYAEGEYVWAALPEGGILTERPVKRGDKAAGGQVLFTLDAVAETAGVERTRSNLAEAVARRDNLLTGLRDSEIDSLLSQKKQAEADLALARVTLTRKQELLRDAFASVADVDAAKAAFDKAEGRIHELEAQLVTARLPARVDEISAANAALEAARAALAEAEWRLARRIAAAPAEGLVTDTFFEPGEFVPAGKPVVSLLPPANIKVRFFVAQAALGALAVGDAVSIACDGCAEPIPAAITFISPDAEFTPPVIYSEDARQKLVFLVEARPMPQDAVKLKPGQPVEVTKP
ncbi:MAG TPA: HlyD family efflux transporter periplasmic adaptor subunit, partial [Sphingomonadales bacterium]|nr:HlyD family efflux transporter periplasmic adaptor subunit [Sphingomonadales bacterium]